MFKHNTMIPMKSLFLSAMLFGLAACGGDSRPPRITGEQAEVLGNEIDARMLEFLEDNSIPGATVAVTKNGRLVLWKGYGQADKENRVAMQPWHRTRIGSVSKVITAIGALQLVDSGDIALDQPVYSSQISVLWGSTGASQSPGFIYQPDGVLNNTGMYLEALVEAPARLNASRDNEDETLDIVPAYLNQGSNQANVEEILDWASRIQVWHILSHRAGYLRNGNVSAAREYWGRGENDPLSYAELHAAMLAGTSLYTSDGIQYRAAPLRFEPNSSRMYSNHGFGLLGLIVSDRSGQPYHDYIQDNVFKPLGLTDIVDAYTFTGLDSVSYILENGEVVRKTNLSTPNLLGLAAGGWAANARDMARILCGLDTRSDIYQPLVQERRLLLPETLATMNDPDSYLPENSRKVLGWDSVRHVLEYDAITKNGAIGSVPGSSRVTKYFYPRMNNVDTEINVAVLVNLYKENWSPPESLLNDIADIVKDASVPASYDLFDAAYRCVSGPIITG